VAAKLRERLSVSKYAVLKFNIQRFHLKKLNNAEVKERHHIKISNRFSTLANLDDNVNNNRTWENI
jgi:hypothetical protein